MICGPKPWIALTHDWGKDSMNKYLNLFLQVGQIYKDKVSMCIDNIDFINP